MVIHYNEKHDDNIKLGNDKDANSQLGMFCHKKYLQIRKELKTCKYTKNTKKQINTKLWLG